MSLAALPSRHVPRPRLVRVLEDASVGLIEAGGGYGKSVLAGELRRKLGTASAEAVVERDTAEARQLVGALRRGLRRAGLSDSAAALTGSSAGEVAEALDRAPEPVLLVVEEAQHAIGEAAELLAGLARELAGGHRLLVVGRRLDRPIAGLAETTGAAGLGPAELAFDDAELRALLERVMEAAPDDGQVAEIRDLTLGWPAASALAASWMARAPAARLRGAGAGPLGSLLEELLSGLDDEGRRRVAHLSHLPLLSEGVAAACAGPGALQLLTDAGLPLRDGRPGWVELADPIREELSAREPLPAGVARSVAAAYSAAGELATALALLADAGDQEGIAALLAESRWQDLRPLDLAELRAILTTLPDDAVSGHPEALVQVSRLAEREGEQGFRGSLLNRAGGMASSERQRREIRAEVVAMRSIDEPGEEVEEEAMTLLKAAAAPETTTRARALSALARVEAWRGDPASMLRAERRLVETAALCRLAGEVEWEAQTLTGLGYRVAFARGDLDLAVTHMSAALALLPESGAERAGVATFLAEALAYVGRLDDAEAAIREAASIGRNLGDHRVQAYAAWTGAVIASLQGDAAATVRRISTVELHPGDWYDHPIGIEFLADAVLALARAGARAEATDYAERARERADASGYPEIAWISTGAVEARWGDPERAEEALTAFSESPQQAPRDQWRTLLLRAYAAERRGDEGAGALAAQAFEAAAELGRPDLPVIHEPDLAAAMSERAIAAGSRAAAAAGEGSTSFAIALMGEFRVTERGQRVEVPAGRPTTLVKLLALAGGTLNGHEAMEALWPGVEEGTGRQRLRNLLNRLRTSCGDLVGRDGEALSLGPNEVDAEAFERAAERAVEATGEARPGLARSALARYTGELLPTDRYEAWATAPRERLRRRYLELLDLLVDDAVDRGDVDEAIRLLDRAQEAEPLDEDRHLRAAELLLFQGRRGSALALVERAEELRNQLGLEESPRLSRLRAATGGE